MPGNPVVVSHVAFEEDWQQQRKDDQARAVAVPNEIRKN
jgi:hypothetical protein